MRITNMIVLHHDCVWDFSLALFLCSKKLRCYLENFTIRFSFMAVISNMCMSYAESLSINLSISPPLYFITVTHLSLRRLIIYHDDDDSDDAWSSFHHTGTCGWEVWFVTMWSWVQFHYVLSRASVICYRLGSTKALWVDLVNGNWKKLALCV